MTPSDTARQRAEEIVGEFDMTPFSGQLLAEEIVEAINAATLEERQRSAKVADQWLSAGFLKLHAGEMTAQEVRTVRAVVTAIASSIRSTEERE